VARTLLETAAHVLGPSAAAVDLQLVDDRGCVHRDPAVVLVSNNPYAFAPPHAPGTRPTLQSGKLGVVSLDRTPHPPDVADALAAALCYVNSLRNGTSGRRPGSGAQRWKRDL